MDSTDNALITLLKNDSRTPNTELAKQLGLSEGAVRKRISNLQNKGIIRQFTIKLGNASAVQAIIAITFSKNSDSQIIIGKIKCFREVQSAYELSGNIDLAVFASFLDVKHFNSFVDNLNAIDGVERTTSRLIMKEV